MAIDKPGPRRVGISQAQQECPPYILSGIDSPQDIKSLSLSELQQLASEIRERIIDVVSKNGGHLAPSLGVVELTIALHYVFDTPIDKIIWDVGHQSYAHKLLTGRRQEFDTLRQYRGISGFPKRDESEYDVFGTGHSSTSISAALGMAIARDLNGNDYKVIAVIGDGALTAGIAYEGLNQAGFLKRDMIVILNDNKMSISENVGGISTYLNKIVTTPVYHEMKNDIWELLGKLPAGLGTKARIVARKLKEGMKNLTIPTIFFEELGFEYIGPIDGHNLHSLIDTFKSVKNLKESIFIHVITEKGKGYPPAENEKPLFHGISKFDKVTGKQPSHPDKAPSYSEIFGKTLVEFAKKDKKICAVTAAMPDGTGLSCFRDKFKERFFDVGIAEQHAVTFASGLALQGLKPVVAIYSTFLQRAFDQVLHDVCLQKIPIVLCLDRAGIVGEDGPTHNGTFDLSYLRPMPDIVIMAPRDAKDFVNMLKFCIDYKKGPTVLRYPKGSAPDCRDRSLDLSENRMDRPEGLSLPRGVAMKEEKIKIGKAEVLKQGKDGTFLAVGSMVYPALEASLILKKRGIDMGVVNARFIKPIDEELLKNISNKPIITIEENTLSGGFGSGVLEFLSSTGKTGKMPVPPVVFRIGLPDQFIEHGSREFLLDKYGLSAKKIAETVKKITKSPPSKERVRRTGE